MVMLSNTKFELGKSKYNLDTYIGRLLHNIELVEPRSLFVTDDKLKESIKLLEDFKHGRHSPEVTDQQLWEAQKIKQAIIHNDTGEKIFLPFRMSAYVPLNSLIMAGILIPKPTFPQIILWQWLNQSHNACVNYANRKPTDSQTFIKSYTGAVSAAVSVSIGLNLLLRRAHILSGSLKNLVQRLVPLPAVASAASLNVILMRSHELENGINVTDRNGHVIGISKLAAKKATKEMATTRALLPSTLLTVSSIIMSFIDKTHLVRKYPRLRFPIQILVIPVCYMFVFPITVSIYPQFSQIETNKLEIEIQERSQEPVVFYNRGL